MDLKQEEDDAGAEKGPKPKNRRLVPITQENIADERPSLYTRQYNLENDEVFSGVRRAIDTKFEGRKDCSNFFYPYITKQEEGIKRSQVREMIEGQIESKSLDYVTAPYIKPKALVNSQFESLNEYRNFCAELVEESGKKLILGYHYGSQPVIHQEVLDSVEFICMHVGMNYLNTYFEKFERQINGFLETADLPVIGYGIPAKVGVNSTGKVNQISDWTPSLELAYFSEKGVPIGNPDGGSSETEWFTIPSEQDVKDVVDLTRSDVNGDKKLAHQFEEYPEEFSDTSPRRILEDSDLEERYMRRIIDSWGE
jgi:hypothetical protein